MSRTLWMGPLAPLALSAALAFPALAAEDGGTRSPFASGAGCRALALGGAYVAIAEDAAALTWNPAGLAQASRAGFEAAHSGQGDLGSREDYLACVLPSWRWGVLGFGLRSFGVGGIEPRDDRNVVVGDEFSHTETEIAIGYARALNEAWSLGGSAKLRRQSLDDLQATALAADLGLLVSLGPALGVRSSWLEGASFGLAVGNAIEPSLRLDRESVRDPRVWRSGLAWRRSVLGERELRLSLDTDQSQGVTPRLHAGAELQVHPLLALRAGVRRDRLTAGAAVAWRDLEMSYAFEDMAIGPVHRFGLSHAFGPTTSASRDAARQAEEQVLQARLDAELLRRRDQRLTELLTQAEEALGRSDFDATMELLASASTLDSADARIRPLEARCQRELGRALEGRRNFAAAAVAFGRARVIAPEDTAAAAGEQRCRAASERLVARDNERRQRFRAALDALVAGDLVRARAGFAALVSSDAGDTEAAAMLERTQEAIAQRAVELVRQARRSLDAQAPDEARRLAARVWELDPRTPGLAELQEALAGSKTRTAAAPARAPDATRRATPAERRRAEEMVKRGAAAMAAGRPDNALHYWELALSLDANVPKAAQYLNREYLARGMDAYAAGRLDEAVGHWEKARHADPSDPRAAGFLARTRERLERTREIFGAKP